eukprot:tig00001030_g6469.t1
MSVQPGFMVQEQNGKSSVRVHHRPGGASDMGSILFGGAPAEPAKPKAAPAPVEPAKPAAPVAPAVPAENKENQAKSSVRVHAAPGGKSSLVLG